MRFLCYDMRCKYYAMLSCMLQKIYIDLLLLHEYIKNCSKSKSIEFSLLFVNRLHTNKSLSYWSCVKINIRLALYL